MGKPTGFMEYERKTAAAVSPKERIKNFCEFHTPLSQEEQRKQAARCMNCGVPFCLAGRNEYHGYDKRLSASHLSTGME